MTENKRRKQRQNMFRVIRYSIEGRAYADLSTNVSSGGMFIKNFSPPPVGTQVVLTVTLPEEWGNLPLRIVGKVAHVNNDPDPHKRGMGVEFTSVVADSVPIIEYFVREIYSQDQLKQSRLDQKPAAGAAGTTTYEYHIDKTQGDGGS